MNRFALITGASKRVGRAIAERLASKGWNIMIHFYTSEREAVELKDRLSESFPGQKFSILQANLENEDEVTRLIPEVVSEYGTFSLLINNASVFEKGYLLETTMELYNRQMNVNFKAPFILTRDFAAYCKQGNVINLVDTRITANKSNFAVYSISKKALWELTKMAALEFAPDVRINAVAPGVSIPPEGKSDEYLKNLARQIPYKQPVGLEPVLQSIDFILENSSLTGQLLFADGGENLGQNT